MLFNSLSFVLFFVLVFSIYWRLKSSRSQHLLLLAASYFFYGYWDYRLLALIWGVTCIAYFGSIAIDRASSRDVRKYRLMLSLVLYLGVLFTFKYFNFFIESAVLAAGYLGLEAHYSTLSIILPVGISFYTFQAISYSVDVYRRHLSADRHFIEVALYIGFFPQLVAGPIVRATDFIPQLTEKKTFSNKQFMEGLQVFLLGYCYKVVLADNLALVADPVFSSPREWDAVAHWSALLAYYGQIYFDFAGYSGMAIGTALMLGFWLPVNFNYPYSAVNITDFWRRWHISLSSWLRDYLYIPLGGNRHGKFKLYRNLMLTMLLGGLWHGAAWTFVVWGAMHGLALAIHKLWREHAAGGFRHLPGGPVIVRLALAFLLTQFWVLIAWLFFRAQSYEDALYMMSCMLVDDTCSGETFPAGLVILVMIPVVVDVITGRYMKRPLNKPVSTPVLGVALGGAVAVMLWLQPIATTAFIYFQF